MEASKVLEAHVNRLGTVAGGQDPDDALGVLLPRGAIEGGVLADLHQPGIQVLRNLHGQRDGGHRRQRAVVDGHGALGLGYVDLDGVADDLYVADGVGDAHVHPGRAVASRRQVPVDGRLAGVEQLGLGEGVLVRHLDGGDAVDVVVLEGQGNRVGGDVLGVPVDGDGPLRGRHVEGYGVGGDHRDEAVGVDEPDVDIDGTVHTLQGEAHRLAERQSMHLAEIGLERDLNGGDAVGVLGRQRERHVEGGGELVAAVDLNGARGGGRIQDEVDGGGVGNTPAVCHPDLQVVGVLHQCEVEGPGVIDLQGGPSRPVVVDLEG